MKKVIRLNENDIEKIVKKIISEERKSINEGPLGWIKKKFNKSEPYGDNLNILKEYEDEYDTAKRFLYRKFMECELKPMKNTNGWTKYVDSMGRIIFMDNIETGDKEKILYFSLEDVRDKLEEMGLSLNEMKNLIKDMLWKVHKRKVDIVLCRKRSYMFI